MSPRILVVEDMPDWIATYEQWLEPDGYEVKGTGDVDEALDLAERWQPHVILVDQKLEGPGGRDLGLSLIGRLATRSPASRLFLVTAFATREAVERAFRNGASDYLRKDDILEPLLRIKVREAIAVAERAMGTLDREAQDALLRATWEGARTERDPQRKGALLEQAIRHLFETIPGLTHARTKVVNPTEEIDVLVTNRSTDPLLSRQGDFIVVECKNWVSTVGTPVTSRLLDKVGKRDDRARLGICVSMNGFAATVRLDLLAERRGGILILLLDGDEVQAWIDSRDRQAWLVRRIEQAVVEG